MDFAAEASIVAEFHKVLMSGQLYRGSKPVMWSPVERTALADAEVEYHSHVSPRSGSGFPVVSGGDLPGAAARWWAPTPLDAEPDPAAEGRVGGDLDHHALDHPG
jgi:isoleucyl-tRNA synthetase